MDALQKEIPEQIHGRIAYDATNYIKNAIHEVEQTLAETLLIVVIVIFLFLGSLRSVLVPVVAIPVSLIGAVFLMQVFGFTVNLLTLLAIVLSVGLVVDDAIVVVENVERHLREGHDAASTPRCIGARELVGPIIAMTITLAAVYAPIAFQGGLTGSLFREFALTLAGAVTISGVVALTLSPVMSAYAAARPATRSRGLSGRDQPRLRAHQAHLRAPPRHRAPARAAPSTLAWIVVSVLALLMFAQSPKELAPTEDQGVIFGVVNTPANSTLDQVTFSTREREPHGHADPGGGLHLPDHLPDRRLLGRRPQALGRAQALRPSRSCPRCRSGWPPSPASRPSRSCPRRCPAADSSRWSSSSPRPPRPRRSSASRQQLQQKAATSGMFAFPPLIDVKIDQPESRDRASTATRWPSSASTSQTVGAGSGARPWAATSSTASASPGAATRSFRSCCAVER